MNRWRWIPQAIWLLLAVIGLASLLALVWVIGPGATWVLATFDGVRPETLPGKDLAAALDAIRGRALAIATGIAALAAVYFTARNAQTARQGHITDRYTKAIEQLGSDKIDVRLGGIYALERIARDSARDHPTVMEVLAAFIRENARRPADAPQKPGGGKRGPRRWKIDREEEKEVPRVDIQAACSVLGRRLVRQDAPRARIDLTGAYLAGVRLWRAKLARADFSRAILAGADLIEADLSDASFMRTDLSEAKLDRATLTHASISDATITYADMTGADLRRAILSNVDLTGTDLRAADIRNALFIGNLTLTWASTSEIKWTEQSAWKEAVSRAREARREEEREG
ncbi:pentapeptide repeat-containing protein [Nonomuraea sp. NBC_00507]|uniref:pentapeptide repeat-containing protein n=1 Tax=Nonomuraea sp. NBC_00507 TaxID=2976002 RepID=UPI002E170C8E